MFRSLGISAESIHTLDLVVVILTTVGCVLGSQSAKPVESGSECIGRTPTHTVAFVDDGLTLPSDAMQVTVNPGGEPGEHFNALYKEFSDLLPVVETQVYDVVGEHGVATPSDIAQGIELAVKNGADIVNVSLAGARDHVNLRDAIDLAGRRGVIVVAATQSGLEQTPSYPASYPSVIGVSPARTRDTFYWFSNRNGANIAAVVPPEAGSSLAAVLTTVKLLNCQTEIRRPIAELTTAIDTCDAPPDGIFAI